MQRLYKSASSSMGTSEYKSDNTAASGVSSQRGCSMNTYLCIVDNNGIEYSWLVSKKVAAEGILRFLSLIKVLQGVGIMQVKTKKTNRARLRLDQALYAEDITTDKTEVES